MSSELQCARMDRNIQNAGRAWTSHDHATLIACSSHLAITKNQYLVFSSIKIHMNTHRKQRTRPLAFQQCLRVPAVTGSPHWMYATPETAPRRLRRTFRKREMIVWSTGKLRGRESHSQRVRRAQRASRPADGTCGHWWRCQKLRRLESPSETPVSFS